MTGRARTLTVALAAALLALLAVGMLGGGLAQTDPPTLGDGDWTVTDTTVIGDWGVVMLRGNLWVTAGGDLTLSNSTLLFVNSESGEHGIVVDGGGSIHIVDGATVGSSRPNVAWTFVVEAGCSLEIRGAAIEECGRPAYGLRPDWRQIALYVGTSDAVIEDSSFVGGLAGLYFEEGVLAPPVRNCTFVNMYGIVSWGTSVEDCVFHDQSIYGVVFHGGERAHISRCVFDGVQATCLQAGYEYFEPYELYTARIVVEDCTFTNSSRAIRVLTGSSANISRCDIEGMEREGIVVWDGAMVDLEDGNILDTTNAIVCSDGGRFNWTVHGGSRVLRGNLTLSGNVSLAAGARLDLLEIRNLTMLSHQGSPLAILVGEGALLRLVNGSIEVPPGSTDPGDWAPVHLLPDGGDLEFMGLRVVDVHPEVMSIRHLVAADSLIRLGTWSAEEVDLVGCTLAIETGGPSSQLRIEGRETTSGSRLEECVLEGLEDYDPADGPWLSVLNGSVESVDFLHGLAGLLGSGAVEVLGGAERTLLEISWSAMAHVHWQNQLPIVGVGVTFVDAEGNEVAATTGKGGYTQRVLLATERAWGGGSQRSYLPLSVGVLLSGLSGSATVEVVDAPLLVDINVIDLVDPRLSVDQGASVATNSTTLNITGRTWDAHSGLAFLEVANLPADYARVSVDDTGHFTATVTLRRGYQTISLRAYDSVGNRVGAEVLVYYSTLAPHVFIDEPIDDMWTNKMLVYVVGQTEPNSTVEAQGRLQVAENGTFRILVHLLEGVNLITVNVTNPAGNHNSGMVTVNVDTRPPALTITRPPSTPYSTSDSTETIGGTVEEGANVTINLAAITAADGFFSSEVVLQQGAKRYVIVATDRAGNTATAEVVFLLDSRPPDIVVLVDGEDAGRYTGEGLLRTSAASVTISVNTEAGALLEVDGQSILLEEGVGSVTYPLVEGLNSISVHVEDAAGNSREFGPILVEVDRTPPLLKLDVSTVNTTHAALFTLRGRTEPNVTLTVNGAPLSTDAEGSFTKNFLLSEGLNQLVLVARDRYGQATVLVHEVVMRPTEPEPLTPAPSPLPYMLGLTLALLVVEVVVLKLWWRRRDPGENRDGD